VNYEESCCLSPIRRNSVLEELRLRRLAGIQEEICCRAFCRWVMLVWKSDGWNKRKSCVSSAYRWWFKEKDETRVLSGVVYMTKSWGPRTEPLGIPKRQVCVKEKSLLHSTRKKRQKNRIWTSLMQCHKCQTKRIDEWVRYCSQWYQRRPIDREGRDKKFCVSLWD